MKKGIRVTLAGLLMVSSQAWSLEPGWYFEGRAGASFLQDSDGEFTFRRDPSADASFDCALNALNLLCVLPESDEMVDPGETVTGDFDTEYDIGPTFGLGLGYSFQNGFRTDLTLDYSQADIDSINGDSSDGEIEGIGLMVNGWYDFNRDGTWHPYVGGGVGAVQVDLQDIDVGDVRVSDDDTVFAFQAGAGVSVDVAERWALDLGYRYRGTDDPSFRGESGDSRADVESEYEQQAVTLALRYVFASSRRDDSDGDGVADIYDECPNTPEGAPVDAQGCPLDTDGDGVPDYKDDCPNTEQGVQVDERGCPLDSDGDGVPNYQDECPGTPKGAPVDDKGCALDSDNDGVPDYRDDCPNTPAGQQVNSRGCPLVVDSDGDGVPDDRDKCPGTPPGVPVLTNGCAVNQSAIMQGVSFEFNKATLTRSASSILDRVAEVLKESPGFVIEIAGHTDSIGSASYNQQLSQARAESARQYLIEQGVNPERLQARGYGESDPIADNDTDEGRASNRRVELRVVGQR